MTISVDYSAPPTVAAFCQSTALVRIILGPVGSGKTTGCMMELLRRAIQQTPAPDGIRYTRFAIVRQTLKQLLDTVLKDVLLWFGKFAEWKVSDKTVYIRFGDVRSEWMFIPLEDVDDQRRLLSSQFTGAWMSEAIEMNVELVGPIMGRCGRYPGANLGGCTWYGVIADTNMPSEGSPWHTKLETERPEEWDRFIQPGGLDDGAENLNYLLQTAETLALPLDHPDRVERGRMYYRALLGSYTEDGRTRYVHARYGSDPSGSAVYRSSFRRDVHVVDDLEPVHGPNLIIAQDFGRNPWSLIGQVDPRQRLLVLEEVEGSDMGLILHIQRNLRPALFAERYLGMSYFVVGDPSGVARESLSEDSPFMVLKKQGFQAYPSPSNKLEPRLTASEGWLIRNYTDGPGCLIDGTRCPNLVKALGGEYRFTRRRSGQLNPEPEKKHPWSDIADCFQYLCQVAGTGMGSYIASRLERKRIAAMAQPTMNVRRRSSGGWT